ncbi:V0D/AC39 family V-type ATPase subunit [Candidatus Nitrosotenuis uzonensis]|uniref:H(+)-transporting two-sector ATPase n=1 Tax=Candidatus Nitrosotenuis uzonensis TaxID=1407055 RepID=A0A812F3K9_9ARCH|nr:V-type ATPase subunit [Candidatus Nitrosotenuis uzonensis]CAE6490005.1 H(+)-transporting two-sector ATPase [Candidatus Nitrosotenuis uzonensis]
MGSGGSQKVFASVKSFSQRGKLLSKSELQTLAEARDLDELITRIKNTKYADAVSKVSKPYTAAGIESALRSELAEIHYSIASTAGKSDVLDAYYLKFLISNLKVILKGKALGKTQEEIEPHLNLHAEELIGQRDVIVKALVSKDLEEAVASLGAIEFGDEVAKSIAVYNEKKNIQVFDVFLDKILYQQLGRAVRNSRDRDLIRLAGMDIDFYNILSILRGKFWGLDEEQIKNLIVTHTPSVPKDLLGKMISSDSVKSVFDELATTRYKDLVPQTDNEIEAVSQFEHNFEMAIYKAVNRSFTKMFSFSTIVGITKLTLYEVRNIAAIAFAVEQKIPPQTTMSRLIVEQEE